MVKKYGGKKHNEIFSRLQDDYYASDRDPDVLVSIYNLAREYISNRFNKYKREKGVLIVDEDEKVAVGAEWFIERYLKDENFVVKTFSAYCHFAYLKARDYNRKQEMNERYSLEQSVEDYGDAFEYITTDELRRMRS